MRGKIFVVKAEVPRESTLYHPYALRFAWSEGEAENPRLALPSSAIDYLRPERSSRERQPADRNGRY